MRKAVKNLVYDGVGKTPGTGIVCLTGSVAEVLSAAFFLNALIDGGLGFVEASHKSDVRWMDGETRLHNGVFGRDVGH